jgi:hypothetical protein
MSIAEAQQEIRRRSASALDGGDDGGDGDDDLPPRKRERRGNLETLCLIPLFIPFARPGHIWNLPVFTVYTYYLQGNILSGASLHAAQLKTM